MRHQKVRYEKEETMKKLHCFIQFSSRKSSALWKFFAVFILAILIAFGGACTSREPVQEPEPSEKELIEVIEEGQSREERAIGIELLERTARELKQPILGEERTVEIELSPTTKHYLERHIHKDTVLTEPRTPGTYYSISSKTAILWAINHLKMRGAEEIKICKVGWIVAPLGGFLIDGKFELIEEPKRYSIFHIGIRDGSEGNAGAEFVFVAKGVDEEGRVVWYPPPGPDSPDADLDYEFLDRESFESMPDRFK